MSAIGAGWLYLGWGALLFHTNYGLMQHSPFEIKERLLKALDKEYNVVDMAAVLEIVTILERTPITKEALETTRLGRDINELRRKTRNESLAKRAKDLVRRWRDLILPQNEGAAPTPVAVAPPTVLSSDTTQQNGSTRIAHPSRSSTASKLHPISPAISLPNSDKSNISPALSTKVEAVPKTHASNKRLRKESSPQTSSEKKISLESSPELPAKRVRTDNEIVENSRLNGDHYDSVGSDCEIVSVTPAQSKIKPRKKTKNRKENTDEVKEKIAKVGKMSKVKTTQELLAGLQKNESINNILVDDDVEKNKTEHIARFLRDESEIIDIENDDTTVEAEPPPPKQELLKTPEEILSRLPPLDLESINWDESPPPSPTSREVTDEDVDRVLNQQIPGLNGNEDHSFRDENVFREWHQVVSRTSMNSDLLHILPYVVID